jgi:hypothetical protein
VLQIATEDEVKMAEQIYTGNTNAGDEKLGVKFYIEAVENKELSLKNNRPTFEDQEFVEIRIPGDRDTIRAPAALYRDRFRSRYEKWKAGQDDNHGAIGLPLREWTGITRSRAEELHRFEVYTVEQLAGVSDVHLQGLGPGFLGLRQKAQAYIEASKGTAGIEQMRVAMEQKDGEIEVLKRALKEQNEQIKEIQKHMPIGKRG